MCFDLKSHNFKANSKSVYKLSRLAIGRISFILYGITFKNADFWKYLNIRRLANLKSRTINKHVKLKRSVL